MEYTVWGIAPGQSHEQPLYTLATTRAQATRMMHVLGVQHWCRQLRIREIDLAVDDLADMLRRAIKG